MFRFEDTYFLYGLLLVPLLLLLFWYSEIRRKKRLRLYGDMSLLKQCMPQVSASRRWTKCLLLLLAVALMFLLLARPKFGSSVKTNKHNGIEAMIALDISNSMLAEDVQPSRLEKSKMIISKLVDQFTNDRVGVIVFAGEAFTQLPITADYISAKMFLDEISPAMISTQGTDIQAAINLAMNSFTPQKGVGKAIIIITDGEDHEPGAEEAAAAAAKKGYHIYVLGVGSPQGAPIPMGNGQYLKDNTGNTVVTKLNEDMCKRIAQAGKGAYIHVDNTSMAQDVLEREINKLGSAEFKSDSYSDLDEQFQGVALLILLVLIAEIVVLERQNPFISKLRIFRKLNQGQKK